MKKLSNFRQIYQIIIKLNKTKCVLQLVSLENYLKNNLLMDHFKWDYHL